MHGDGQNVPERQGPAGRAPDRLLDLDDARLLAQCDLDTYRASGPGGQKRNKTSSAVRLRHGPTGLIVTASESRSQHENRARALRRLREAIALTQREPLDPASGPPAFFRDALSRAPGLRVNPRHDDYYRIIQFVLDLLAAARGSVADAAASVALSTAQLTRFLRCDPKLWTQANRIREEFGRSPLR